MKWLIWIGVPAMALLGGVLVYVKTVIDEVLRKTEPLAGARAAKETERETLQGRVVGFEPSDGGYTWLGIPYGTAQRWRAPKGIAPWNGVREALVSGNRSPQFNPTDRVFGGTKEDWGKIVGSEDCLYLNVHTPKLALSLDELRRQRLPVLTVLHFGGNSVGWGSRISFAKFASDNNVVVVSVNYRLGFFGAFYHSGLHDENSDALDRSGNYGTLDIIAALGWVRENIQNFGGDPVNVTIFGGSSGSKNSMAVLLSPLAAGLYHRAIMLSGLTDGVPHEVGQNFTDENPAGHADSSNEVINRLLIIDGRASDREHAKTVQAGMSPQEVGAYLRGKTVAGLLAAVKPDLYGKYSDSFFFRDGTVLPNQSFFVHAAKSPAFRGVPTIIGTTRDESRTFLPHEPGFIKKLLKIGVAPKETSLIPAEYQTKAMFWLPAHYLAKCLAERGETPTYLYRFDWDEHPSNFFIKHVIVDLRKFFGAHHVLDIHFFIGDFRPNTVLPLLFIGRHDVVSRDALCRQYQSYIIQFMRTGSPGEGLQGDLPPWRPYTAAPNAGTYITFATPKGGGIRELGDHPTKAQLIKQVAYDPRLTDKQRRVIFARMLQDERIFTSGKSYSQYPEYSSLTDRQ
jgi:para-nitrobenzyl esterase